MKKQSGFTLIELVIVIVILGILAATAVPKFVNLQGDARKAAMKGVKGALEGAAAITYAKAAIDGFETLNEEKVINGVATTFGYPSATSAALNTAAGLSETDWTMTVTGSKETGKAIIVAAGTNKTTEDDSGCNVSYKAAATSAARPTITVYNKGC